MEEQLLPMASVVLVESVTPPTRLVHVPNTPAEICPGCETRVSKSVLKFGNHDWHPECFRCSLCRKAFEEPRCVQKEDLILHPDCYKECFCERCAKCTKLIDKKEAIQAAGMNFHISCFQCYKCGQIDSNKNKASVLFGLPYCRKCFEELQEFFPKCVSCKKVIMPSQESKEFFFKGKKYFAHYPQCYKCVFCPTSLTPKLCAVYQDHLICRKCYDNGLKKVCAQCNEPIFESGSKMENIWWHTHHFICSVCHTILKPNTCNFSNGNLKCRNCASEDRVKCTGCGKPVLENGVHACGSVWHTDCLKCQFCKTNVFKVKFSNIRNKPCCENCFNKLKAEGRLDKRNQLVLRPGASSSSKKKDKDSSSSSSSERPSRKGSESKRTSLSKKKLEETSSSEEVPQQRKQDSKNSKHNKVEESSEEEEEEEVESNEYSSEANEEEEGENEYEESEIEEFSTSSSSDAKKKHKKSKK